MQPTPVEQTRKRRRVVGSSAAAAPDAAAVAAAKAAKKAATAAKKAKKLAEMDAKWEWKAEEIEVHDIPFTLTPGPRNCPAKMTVVEAFTSIFSRDLLQHIVDDTNAYSAWNGNFHQLGSIMKEELCTYLAILMSMSMKTAPALKDHWSKDPLLGSPWIKEKMSRDRWLSIHKALHFNILHIEERVREASRERWTPTRKVCIDEGIGPWQGKKKGLRVYIIGKPHPNGIKIYILADEYGYVYDFWIYRGTQPPVSEIVMNFVKKLPGQYPTFICTIITTTHHSLNRKT